MVARLRLNGFLVPFLLCSVLLIVPTFIYLAYSKPKAPINDAFTSVSLSRQYEIGEEVNGDVIMPKLPNATAKAELGRASWKLLHTMAQRYPENPTADQKSAFRSYIYLFSRLYPCGECAEHFQKLLREFPPQTSSRKTASMWLCAVHNRVNERLEKPEFDCTQLDGLYDCGCGDEGTSTTTQAKDPQAYQEIDSLTGENLMAG